MKQTVVKKLSLMLACILTVMSVIACSDTAKEFQPKTTAEDAATSKRSGSGDEVVFYVTRHGKTLFNTVDRVQGWCDSFLTEEGIGVAQSLGKGLKIDGIHFDAAYSSDLGRARQTGRIVLAEMGQTDLPITEMEEFREANYGQYEGDFNTNMAEAMAKELGFNSAKVFMESDLDMFVDGANALHKVDPSAEDAETIRNRTLTSLEKIAKEELARGGGNVLLVGHGMSITIMISQLTDIEVNGHLPNASVTKIVYKDGAFIVESVGDTSYIEKGK